MRSGSLHFRVRRTLGGGRVWPLGPDSLDGPSAATIDTKRPSSDSCKNRTEIVYELGSL